MIEVNPWRNDNDSDELANWDAETLYTCTADSPVDVNIPELLKRHREYDGASISVDGGRYCLPVKTHDDTGKQQGRGILSNSMALVTMLPRISAAQKELAAVRRSAVPMSLDRQRKILNDLLEITRDDVPMQLRRAALKFLHLSFEYLLMEIFVGATRRLFLRALKDLCSDDLSFAERKDGCMLLFYLVGAGANLGNKTFALEYEDCRMILNMLRRATIPSLKLATSAYFWHVLSCKFEKQVARPVSDEEHREICLLLADLCHYPYPLQVRKDALDMLWRYETNVPCLKESERDEVWSSVLDLSELKGKERLQREAAIGCLSGVRRLWWFSALPHWTKDMAERKDFQHEIGKNLLMLMDHSYPHNVRTQAYELVALFSNLPHWIDMYEQSVWRRISVRFTEFCLNDTSRVNIDDVQSRAISLLARSDTITLDIAPTKRQMQIAKRSSFLEFNLITAAAKTVHRATEPLESIHNSLENLAVFIMPDESVLVQKDQQAILYERICDYARLPATRDVSVSAMCALITIQDWLSSIRFAMGPSEED